VIPLDHINWRKCLYTYSEKKEYKWLQACTWRGWLLCSFNITTVNLCLSALCERDHYLDWHIGLGFLCSGRLHEDGISVPKHVEVWYLSWIVFYDLYILCILLSAFVGWYIEYKNMHGMNNIKIHLWLFYLYT